MVMMSHVKLRDLDVNINKEVISIPIPFHLFSPVLLPDTKVRSGHKNEKASTYEMSNYEQA